MSFRDRLDVEHLLQTLGIHAVRRGNNLKALCPNPDHLDTTPSWTIVDSPGSPKHGGHKCFACGFEGGPWELVMAVRGLDERQAGEFVTALILGRPRRLEGLPTVRVRLPPTAAPEYRLPRGVCIPSVDGSAWPKVFSDYLTARGVTAEQTVRWHIGFATWGRLAWRVVIPVHTRGRLVAHVARAVFADRVRYDMPRSIGGACSTMALLGEPLIESARGVLTIVEGAFSLLALERAGAVNPVALLGSDWSVDKAAILSASTWRHVIIATDPDHAGDRVARAISMSFRKTKITRLRMVSSPDDCELVDLQASIAALSD